MNLRPSGYEPDELPGCSIPRHWHWTPRIRSVGHGSRQSNTLMRHLFGLARPGGLTGFQHCKWVLRYTNPRICACCKAWRRPTLPTLERQYHRRCLVSRPSSRWDRVGHRRYGHQAMKQAHMRVFVLKSIPCTFTITNQRRHRSSYPHHRQTRAVVDGGTLKCEKSN